jgi:hypothetical protein
MSMARAAPIADLDRHSAAPARSHPSWADARRQVREAEALWLSTVRPDGEPQVVPLIAVALEDAGRVVECGELEE